MKRILSILSIVVLWMPSFAAVGFQDIPFRKTLVIPVQFLDVKFTVENPRERIESLFNERGYSKDGSAGSVMDYLQENIWGEAKFSFEVCDVVTLTKKSSFYGDDINYKADAWVSMMVTEACRAAQKNGVLFSDFDSNDDGLVDNVFIIFAGYNQAESGNKQDIRPQVGEIVEESCILDGKRIASFGCYSEYSGAEGRNFAGPGTICHECLHYLGLVDLYDVNAETEGLSSGLHGTTALMDYGNYNNGGKHPPYLNAVELEMLGLLDTEIVEVGKEYELEPLRISHKALRIDAPYDGEYFLLECRDNYKWDEWIGGKGLMVYHIDKTTNNAGSLTADVRWGINAVNCVETHPCASLFDALGNGRKEELFYPSHVSGIISSETNPLMLWDGTGVGMGIVNIRMTADGKVSFSVVEDNGWNIPHVVKCNMTVNQSDAVIDWIQDRESVYDEWTVVYGPCDGTHMDTLRVMGNSCRLVGLEPGTKYRYEIYMNTPGGKGKSSFAVFTTIPEKSDYPMIAEMKPSFSVGESVRLHIINIKDDSVQVRWYVDGVECVEGKYIFNVLGTHFLKAVYLDGGREFILEKKVIVK